MRVRPPPGVRQVPDVADRTIEPDELDAAVLAPDDADRQVALPALGVALVEEAEGAVVGRPWNSSGKSRGSACQTQYGSPLSSPRRSSRT